MKNIPAHLWTLYEDEGSASGDENIALGYGGNNEKKANRIREIHFKIQIKIYMIKNSCQIMNLVSRKALKKLFDNNVTEENSSQMCELIS